MKRLIAILMICFALLAVGSIDLYAQKGKVAKKIIELVSKGGKKAPKKPVHTPKFPARKTTPKTRPRITTPVKCSQCNGKGIVTYWNSFSGQYQTVRCSKCNGKGQVNNN